MKVFKIVTMLVVSLLFSAGVALAEANNVNVANKEGVGKYLTDDRGMTLYWFAKDTPEAIACTGGCLDKWPVYYRETVVAPEGINKDDFGTITRPDGSKQVTFRCLPLYYWQGDTVAGDTKGNKVYDLWFVVNPDTFRVQ